MEIRLTACSFDMDRPKSVRNARREPHPDRRLLRVLSGAVGPVRAEQYVRLPAFAAGLIKRMV
jgi:hypothetical protein